MEKEQLKVLFNKMGEHWGKGQFTQAFEILEMISAQMSVEEMEAHILVNDMTVTEIFRKFIEVSLYKSLNESPVQGFLSRVAARMIENQNEEDWRLVGESLRTCLLGMEAENTSGIFPLSRPSFA